MPDFETIRLVVSQPWFAVVVGSAAGAALLAGTILGWDTIVGLWNRRR